MSDIDDFGFSLVSEDELKEQEKHLQQVTITQGSVLEKSLALTRTLKEDITELRDMIRPLLTNLGKDPEKEYIFWPDRVAKLSKFTEKFNAKVKQALDR